MVTTSGHPEGRKSGKLKMNTSYNWEKGEPFAKYELGRVHEPKNETEKAHFTAMLGKIYSSEYKYQTGKINRNTRDEQIEEAEEEYDSR